MMYLIISIAIAITAIQTPDYGDYKYAEVEHMNESEFHLYLHNTYLDIVAPEYYDWEETANAIGVDVEDLTMTMYYGYLGIYIINEKYWSFKDVDVDY